MDLFSETDNSLDMLQTEGGFKTSLFGFSRAEVLAYIDRMMMTNAGRNKHLNNSLVEMEGRLSELQEENTALLDKTKVLVDQLAEARSSKDRDEKVSELNIIIGELNVQNEDFRSRIDEQKFTIEDLQRQVYAKEQESKIVLAENDTLKSRIQKLEQNLEKANETSKYADETIVAAQRAASKIMTDAARKIPKKEKPPIDLTLLRDNIQELEKQLHSVVETVEFAVTGHAQNEESSTASKNKDEHKMGTGWISATPPEEENHKSVSSYWHPAERPNAPIGWQQPPEFGTSELPIPLALQKQQPYYHRREEQSITPPQRAVKLVRPTFINYRELRADKARQNARRKK